MNADNHMEEVRLKRVLMIAFHYPPQHGSSGIQRTLSFANYLPECGWHPIVLSASPRAYRDVNKGQLKDISKAVQVFRAFALDTRRHLSIKGRYSRFMSLPDQFVTWWFGAVPKALFLIKKYKPDVIWTTYPIATAHLIGLTLHKLTGIPWVADFRDSMTEPNYPENRLQKAVYLWIEKRTVKYCENAVFTTPRAVKMYAERYPEISENKWVTIENGYDEKIFKSVEDEIRSAPQAAKSGSGLVLVHSGILYPSERDPRCFFAALAQLKNEGKLDSEKIRVVLRATGHDSTYKGMLTDLNLNDIVFLEPSISYRDAFREMLSSDGLIIFQASNCNHQIPAKIYEYLRAKKPVLALTDSEGDTAKLLEGWGIAEISPLDNKDSIIESLLKFVRQIESGYSKPASPSTIERYSRKSATKYLASLLDQNLRRT